MPIQKPTIGCDDGRFWLDARHGMDGCVGLNGGRAVFGHRFLTDAA
jgi:hypothetical protein